MRVNGAHYTTGALHPSRGQFTNIKIFLHCPVGGYAIIPSMKIQALTFFASVLAAHVACATWNIEETVDEMTDTKRYILTTLGETVQVNKWLRYRPTLIVRLTPQKSKGGKITFKHETFIDTDVDSVDRYGIDAAVRFDSEEPTVWQLSPSTDRGAAFFINEKAIFKKLREADWMLFRYETTLGSIRTYRFDLTGLREALLDVKSRALAVPGTVPNESRSTSFFRWGSRASRRSTLARPRTSSLPC